MAQWTMVLSAKSDYLSVILGTHRERNNSKLSSDAS